MNQCIRDVRDEHASDGRNLCQLSAKSKRYSNATISGLCIGHLLP